MGTLRASDAALALEYLGQIEAAADTILPALHDRSLYVPGVAVACGTIRGAAKFVRGMLAQAAVGDVTVETPKGEPPC